METVSVVVTETIVVGVLSTVKVMDDVMLTESETPRGLRLENVIEYVLVVNVDVREYETVWDMSTVVENVFDGFLDTVWPFVMVNVQLSLLVTEYTSENVGDEEEERCSVMVAVALGELRVALETPDRDGDELRVVLQCEVGVK